MKRLTLFALLLLMTSYARAQTPDNPPQIGLRKTATLSPSYSCRSNEEFQKGYEGAALFLSDSMKRVNSPDLLFNSACKSKNYFDAATHGGNYSLIADVAADTDSSQLLSLVSIVDKRNSETIKKMGFKRSVPVISGHTYAVLLDKHEIQGLFIFTVTDYVPDSRVELSYEILDYQITQKETKTRISEPTKKNIGTD